MTPLTDLLKPIRERLAAIVEWNTNYKGTVDKTELLVQFEGARIALLKDATDLDRLLRVVQYLSEALTMYSNERNWISRQTISGRVCEEWSVIDEKYRYGHDRAKEALTAAQKILEEK